MKLYVYCLVEGVGEVSQSLQGVAGAAVRRLETGKFSFLVSDFAGDVVPVNRENALAHAAVVQSALRETTPLPLRFGTLVTEQQLENYVSAKHDALRAKLEQVNGCVEMSVKIISGQKPAAEPVAVETQEKPGTAFLAEKRREILGSEARTAEAKRVAEWLDDEVRGFVRATRTDVNPTDKLLVAAAHLVERERVPEYRTRLKEEREGRPELHFLVSGPWAPYSFANIDLEFETHFGVS